jgi:pimeloyl-ACP methyl ester carboxylesterase
LLVFSSAFIGVHRRFHRVSALASVPDFDPVTFGQRFTRRTALARGIKIHYVEGGSGNPVLLVPGWPQSWYAWRHVMPLLAETCRVIAIDPPGLGDSERPAAYDTATIATYVDAFVDALGLDRVDFVGHDIGAWIGYAFAARYPAKVRRLALVDAAIPGIAPAEAFALTPERINKTWHFFFNALPDLPEALVAGRERIYLAWLFNARSIDKSAIDDAALVEYTRVYSAPGAMSAGFAYYRAIFDSMEQNRATAANKLAMPVLAAGGAQWLGPFMEKMIAPVARNLRVEIVGQCGHFVPEEAPQAIARALLDFIGRP